jgi:hypothetical protein
MTVDAVAAIFNALLAPCALHFLNNHFAGATLTPDHRGWYAAAYAPWEPIYSCAVQPVVASHMTSVAFCDSQSGSLPGTQLPGTEAMTLTGITRYLMLVYQSSCSRYTARPAEGAVEWVLAVYEREMQGGSALLRCAPPSWLTSWHA